MARILVIDDDESLLQMMSLMLTRAGHEPILASNGHVGIELARTEHPDMAIVDVMMPEISGYEVCRTLREDPATMNIPLMILTALAGKDYDEEAIRAGADDYLTKPVTRSDLASNVNRLLETGAINQPEPLEEDSPQVVDDPPQGDRDQSIEETFTAPAEPRSQVLPSLIAVVGAVGGVGATTLAINLSLGAMQFGRACLVDLHKADGHAAANLQMSPSRSWLDLTHVTPDTDKRDIGSSLSIHKSGVALLASPTRDTDAYIGGQPLSVIYNVLSEGFKRIVVDLPDIMSPMSIATIRQAAHIVVVVGENPATLSTAAKQLATLDELRLPGSLHVVINRTRPHGVSYEDVTTTLQRPIAADIPYEAEQVNAVMQGTPLLMSQPNSLFSRAILYLARQL